jgi:hypothetical protein
VETALWQAGRVDPPRSLEQRKADALLKLTAHHSDAWVASGSTEHPGHLVPLSFAWDGHHVIVATETRAITTANLVGTGRARLAFGGSRDVVMMDSVLASAVEVNAEPSDLADRYAEQADWDPRAASGSFTYLLLRPERIQVWREANEIAGRTVMRSGQWLV